MGEVATVNPIEELPAVWQNSLVTDVALGIDDDTICEAYGLQYPQLQAIKQHASFRNRLGKLTEELQKEGVSFKLKAQMQAEELLKTSFTMIHDPDIDPKVREKLIANTVRWAGYDNKAEEKSGAGSNISISIDLGNADKAVDGRVFENGD